MAKEEKDQEQPSPKVSVVARGVPIKLVLIIGAGALLLGLAGTFAIVKLTSHEKTDQAQAATPPPTEQHDSAPEAKGTAGPIFDLEPFIVNLADSPEIRYLKLTMKLELEAGGGSSELNARTPQVRDAILVLLSSKDSSAIRTTQGKFQLREELTQRVNAVLPKRAVRTVYFTEFVLQ